MCIRDRSWPPRSQLLEGSAHHCEVGGDRCVVGGEVDRDVRGDDLEPPSTEALGRLARRPEEGRRPKFEAAEAGGGRAVEERLAGIAITGGSEDPVADRRRPDLYRHATTSVLTAMPLPAARAATNCCRHARSAAAPAAVE